MASRRSFGFGLENIGLWAARKPRLAGACLTVLLVICAAFVPQLKFDDNVNRVFMSDSVRADEFSRTLDMIGAGRSDIIVLFRSDRPIEAAQIATLRELSLDLEFEDGVVSVVSPFSARFAQTHPAYPGEPLFPFEFTTSELKARLSAYFSSDQPVGPLITQDLHMAMFIINYADDGRADHQRLFVDRLTSLIDARIGEEISATLTGETPMALKIADELKADLVRLNAAASAIIFLIGLVLFRNIWTALFALLPALLSAFVTLGLFAMLGYPITVVSNIIPVLVLVLALADNIHLIQHYRQHGAADASTRAERVCAAIAEVGPACALAALTTAISFLAIAVSDNQQLFEFAIVGMLGMVCAYLVVIICFGVGARFLPVVNAAAAPRDAVERGQSALCVIATAVTRRPNWVIGLGAILFIVAAAGHQRNVAWFSFNDHLPLNSDFAAVNQQIAENFDGLYQIWIEYPADYVGQEMTEQSWQGLQALTSAVKTSAPDTQLVSLDSVSRWLGKAHGPPTADELAQLPELYQRALFDREAGLTRVLLFVPDPMRSTISLARQDAIEQAARQHGAVVVTGLPVVMRHESITLVTTLGLGLLLACLVGILLITLAFRWPLLAGVLLLPNLLPLLLTSAALQLINNGELNPTAVLALTLAFGIAVDDSIHFVARYRLNRDAGRNIDTALRQATKEAGSAMTMTTILLSLGMLVVFLSAFEPVRLFGTMLMLSFSSALVADLVLLPAILKKVDR